MTELKNAVNYDPNLFYHEWDDNARCAEYFFNFFIKTVASATNL